MLRIIIIDHELQRPREFGYLRGPSEYQSAGIFITPKLSSNVVIIRDESTL